MKGKQIQIGVALIVCIVFGILLGCIRRDDKYYALLEAKKLNKLVGNWVSVQSSGYLHENWTPQSDTSFAADFFMLDENKDTVFVDKISIRYTGSHFERVLTSPKNKNQFVVYTLINSGKNNLVFERHEKNISDKVTYTFTSNGGMVVKLESSDKNHPMQNQMTFVKEEQR